MKISVVIPLFNKENSIARAVDSVLSQTHSDWELIVVDDGSADQGPAIVAAFRDPRIRCISQANAGASAARNTGVAHARGAWIAFLDADDAYEADFLARCVEVIDGHTTIKISMIACNYRIVSNTRSSLFWTGSGDTRHARLDYFRMCRGNVTPVTSSSVVVSKALFHAAGGFPTGIKYFEDWILWMRLAWLGAFFFLYAPLSNYYRSSAGVSDDNQIDASVLFRCASTLVEASRVGARSSGLPTAVTRRTCDYINRFIVCESRTLSRLGYPRLALRLLTQVHVSALAAVFSLDMAYVLGYLLRSFLRRPSAV